MTSAQNIGTFLFWNKSTNLGTAAYAFADTVPTHRSWEGCAGAVSMGGAGAGSVMCSYGVFNDVPTCENVDLLDRILRQDLGFADNVVVSDCGAVSNACAGVPVFPPC